MRRKLLALLLLMLPVTALADDVAYEKKLFVEKLKKDAGEGKEVAQARLGQLYQKGGWQEFGIGQDDAKAVEWFTKAAKRNNAEALDGLGYAYETGRGVPQDAVQAYAHYYAAEAASGYFKKPDIVANRQKLEKHLSADQVAKGKKIALSMDFK